MLLATALALLITGCAQRSVYCSKQTGSNAFARKPSPIILRFWNWARKLSNAAKICGGAENIVKTEAKQTFVNGLLHGFVTLGIYTPLTRVYCSQ